MSDKSATQLLNWASNKISEAQQNCTYGTVTIFLEAGVITRVETKIQSKPDPQELTGLQKR